MTTTKHVTENSIKTDVILKKVARFVKEKQLLNDSAHYIVALSGGADSIALALIMKKLHVNISAAHCNFHLRGEESDRDEKFCVDFCKREGITLHRVHFDTTSYAQLHKQSIEMAARELRYHYFAQLARDIEADGILVAHHRDDNVETLLLNLLRGSGVDGLAAIAPKNGNIIRPLLCISRNDILCYLKAIGQVYVTDSTNLEDDALRNKIRHHVIPLLESINPSARENIALAAKYLRQAKTMLDSMLADGNNDEQSLDSVPKSCKDLPNMYHQVKKIDRQKILEAASPEYVLHHLLGKYGFHGEMIDQIYQAITNSCMIDHSDTSVGKVWKTVHYMVTIDREQLLVIPMAFLEKIRQGKAFIFPEEGNFNIGLSDGPIDSCKTAESTVPALEKKVKIKSYPRPANFTPSKAPKLITLDADKIFFPLTYRLVQNGDRFQPFGMKGSKLVSDYLTDRKRSYLQKVSQYVLTDKNGEIIWLIGERTSDKCKIDDTTQNVLEISIQ